MEQSSIHFYYEIDNLAIDEKIVKGWIAKVALSEDRRIDEINFIFCSDDYLLNLNQRFLKHDTLTDIITFDNSMGSLVSGEVYISYDRVIENAQIYECAIENELKRVMIHGVLHLCGFKDGTKEEKELMRSKEDEKLAMFHVEH